MGLQTLSEMCQSPPMRIATRDIQEGDRLDHRVAMVNVVFPNVVGMNVGYVEWCPNATPPGVNEVLGWIWVLRPDLSEEITEATSNEYLKEVIERYLSDDSLR